MAADESTAAPRVLIAEPDPRVRELLTRVLRQVRADVQVDTCEDGSQAMARLVHLPDLVIACRDLGGLDGLDLLRSVRRDGRKPVLPFILMSDHIDSASVREALPLAPSAYLTKPLNLEALGQRLQDLLSNVGQTVEDVVPVMMPGMTLSRFLDMRRADTEGAPLLADVHTAVLRSLNPRGLNLRLFEAQIRTDPQITAVLIAAANSASQHREGKVQTVLQALGKLGAVQSLNLILGLALKRTAKLKDAELAQYAEYYWGLSLHTAEYARTLARMLEIDQERCYCAGLLHCLGDLALLRCLQEWKMAGGKLEEGEVAQALKTYGASYGSELRRRWRLPLELRDLIAAIYGFGGGVYARDDLAMNLAAQMARLKSDSDLEEVAKSKSARLLKMGVPELTRLRRG